MLNIDDIQNDGNSTANYKGIVDMLLESNYIQVNPGGGNVAI